MKVYHQGMEIGKEDWVGIIFNINGIFYPIFSFGIWPKVKEPVVKVFVGTHKEVMEAAEKLERELNCSSEAYQRHKAQLDEENHSAVSRVRHYQRKECAKRISDKDLLAVFDYAGLT